MTLARPPEFPTGLDVGTFGDAEYPSRRTVKIRSTYDYKNSRAFQLCFMGGLKVFMGTLAHVQPRKTLSEKKSPSLGSFFVDARLPAPDFFLLESKYKI